MKYRIVKEWKQGGERPFPIWTAEKRFMFEWIYAGAYSLESEKDCFLKLEMLRLVPSKTTVKEFEL